VKRLLLDVNVVLDFLLDRPPHAEAAVALWAAAEQKAIEVLLPAHGVTTVYYLASQERGAAFARRVVGGLLAVSGVAPVDGAVLLRGLALSGPDFEDAVCAAAAEAAGCDAIVTRDPKGFRDCPVTVIDPPTALALMGGDADRVSEGPARVGRERGRREPRRLR
jgi:predicted nucleic acid-binding protein